MAILTSKSLPLICMKTRGTLKNITLQKFPVFGKTCFGRIAGSAWLHDKNTPHLQA